MGCRVAGLSFANDNFGCFGRRPGIERLLGGSWDFVGQVLSTLIGAVCNIKCSYPRIISL